MLVDGGRVIDPTVALAKIVHASPPLQLLLRLLRLLLLLKRRKGPI
jgi:hypothetical protein